MKLSFQFPHSASSNATRQYRRRVLMLACVLIAVLPLAWRGTSCGNDFDFHLESWLEVVRQWHQGVFYPHWAAAANYEAGEPRFVFYPPISWMLGALLGIVLPWTWTSLVFTLIAFLGCAYGFYAMAREWMPDDAAAFAACIYVVNPYLMFVAYERAAYGELLAAALLPLVVLSGLRRAPATLPLGLTVASLWLTDAPAAVMGCYMLAVIALAAAAVERRWRLVARAIGGVALGLALAAFYIVPAWYEQRWVEIARALAPGMRIEDSFLFGHTGDAYHDQLLRMASWIAIALLALTLVAAVRSRKTGTLWKALVVIAALIAFLLLPFSNQAWQHLPELRFLQFPWRWLLTLGICSAGLCGLALRGGFREAKTRRDIRSRAVCALLLACCMAWISTVFFWQPCDDEDNVAAQISTFHDGGFEGTDEYTADGADNGDIQIGLPRVRVLASFDANEADSSIAQNPAWKPAASLSARVQVEQWNIEHKRLSIITPAADYAVLRLMDYPAWRVRVNGVLLGAQPHREDGLMAVPLAAGVSEITISYGTTGDVWLGRAISLVALIVLAILYLTRRKYHPKHQV